MNGIMGESSTEVLGSHRAVKKGDGASESEIRVTPTGSATALTLNANDVTTVSAGTYQVEADDDHVFINGVEVSEEGETTYNITVSTGDLVQIIAQSGTESPFVTVLKCN